MFYQSTKPEPSDVQGICTAQGCTNVQAPKGSGRFRAMCNKHHRDAYSLEVNRKPRPPRHGKNAKYIKHRKTYCERCGPDVKYHPCQLDVHHKDEDHNNNDPENLVTLCANCHRLHHYMERHAVT